MGKRTDTELLDAIDAEGMGVALLHDDDGHWFVVSDGVQQVVEDGPQPFTTQYFIVGDEDMPRAGRTAREAIDLWMDQEQES